MAVRKRSQFQIDTNEEIRLRAKVVALDRGFNTLGDLIHDALIKEGDPKLTKLIKEFLETKRRPGGQPKNQ
jgi:hypothetical protein